MTLADITVRRFENAMFKKDYTGIDNWDELFMEYIETGGMGNTMQLNLMVQIHNLTTRRVIIDAFLDLQKKFFINFDAPFEPAFEDVRKYGHFLKFDASNPTDFVKQLQRVEMKERTNVAQVDKLTKELSDLQATGKVKETANTRADFVKLLNSLNKDGYRINKDTDDMESVCIMIKTHNEDASTKYN